MDTPPIPKPRKTLAHNEEPHKMPVPLPRTKLPTTNHNPERISATDILQSISTASKQFTEDVASKVQSSARTANVKIEKSIADGTRKAKETIEKTISTSRAVRDSVTKSLIEGTKNASLRLRKSKNLDNNIDENDSLRCASMPVDDLSLFDNIQFHSPLLEMKNNVEDLRPVSLNATSDDVSISSTNSFSYVETSSIISSEGLDNEQIIAEMNNLPLDTYDMPKSSNASSVSFENNETTPDVIPRKTQSQAYENWNPFDDTPIFKHNDIKNRVSKSTIYEFDPLNRSSSKLDGVSNELLLLQSFLVGDLYGIVNSKHSVDTCSLLLEEVKYSDPPPPPERTDSLQVEDDKQEVAGNTNWFVDVERKLEKKGEVHDEISKNKTNLSVRKKVSSMLKLDMLSKSEKATVPKLELVQKPPVGIVPTIFYKGIFNRVVSGVTGDLLTKNSQLRYSTLNDQKLMCYADVNHTVLKEEFSFDSISSLQMVLPLTSSTKPNHYCFELMISTGTQKNVLKKLVFSCTNAIERRTWGQMIIENLAHGFFSKHTSEFTRCGWCYLKEGVNGQWQGVWIMIIRRVILYYSSKDTKIKDIDLRKTRSIVTQAADKDTKLICPSDSNNNLLLDCPNVTLYLRFQHEKELKGWMGMINLAAYNNGTQLHHQQLTREDVPTIVDKCISFLYAYGSLTEGIYRRAGCTSVRNELLTKFRRNAWLVNLSATEHTEHDIAGVLKKFFRDLSEPLIHKELHGQLLQALTIQDDDSRRAEYRKIMAEEPIVTRNTMRKLFAHLHFLQTLATVNKMTAENLASVWVPTIMPGNLVNENPNPLEPIWLVKEIIVIRELIAQYEIVWNPTEHEKLRELTTRNVLMRVLSRLPPAVMKAAGDLKTWVYVGDKNTCVHITLNPTKTSEDVCIELSAKAGIDSHLLMLEEVICGDSLTRIINIHEIVLNVVLRWGYWDENDRKDNYLLVTGNKTLYQIDSLKSSTSLVCGELKFANESSKTFKPYMFEFRDTKLCYYKDKQGSQQIGEWNIKDILWYVGFEPKRNPHSRWAITFISKNNKPNRSKDKPFFGCTIAGSVADDSVRWMTAMMFAEYNAILPSPLLVIT